jgi:diguanylate cyclase (GGDEF)-like protein
MWEHVTRGDSWRGEFVNRRKDGHEYTESVMISPVRDGSGRITSYLAIKEDITELKLAEKRIEHLAHFDQLTGLPNRSLLQDHFKFALSLAQRSGEHLAIMFLDLDHFKDINDTLGHSIGDQLLMEVAKRLKAALRDEDTISRLGGDEFIFILPGTDAIGAVHIAEKLLTVVSTPCLIEQHELISTPSIGIAIYPEDGKDMETLSKNADAAMYQVKQAGRNDFRFFTPAMQSNSARNLSLGSDLRSALLRNQLKLHYQPQVSMQDGHIVGAEALLRWQHPTLGAISPAEFIPIAEDTGLIIPIGEWVLRTAAMQMKAWLDKGLPSMVMAVNLSAIQFRHTDLVAMVTGILAEVGLPPNNLELELTEAVAMDDPLVAIAVMDQLFEKGVRMSIDDFGTGYSSLSYLKRFKVYKLKIDQSFVQDIGDDDEDKAIVSAIINMASSLGMHTIAEGVETASQLAFLRLHGCDEVQGYFFSKPLPADDFEAFVLQQPTAVEH